MTRQQMRDAFSRSDAPTAGRGNMRTYFTDSRFKGTRERWTYRGYLISRTDAGRCAVEGWRTFFGDWPTWATACNYIDSREGGPDHV